MVFVGKDDCLYPVAQPQLSEYVRDVRLHGAFAQVEVSGELGVALACGEQAQRLEFAIGELVKAGGVLVWSESLCVVLDDPPRNRRGE